MKETTIEEFCHMFLHGSSSVNATCGNVGVLGRTAHCAIILYNLGLALQDGITPSSLV